MNISCRWFLYRLVALGLLALSAKAQWQEQVIRLNPGWNAVFLEVQPEPSTSELAFANVPVLSAWMWDKPGQVVEFVDDPTKLVPGRAEWKTYLPKGDPHYAVKNLFDLEGGRALLVNLGGNQPVDWKITGRPKVPKYQWLSDSYNLVGFPLEPSSTHTFGTLLASSAAHANKPVLRLEASGAWLPVTDLAKERVVPGRAYWVFTSGPSTFAGPIEVATTQGQRLDFGDFGVLGSLSLGNPGTTPRTYFLDLRPSQTPPVGQAPLAGEVPFRYRRLSVDPQTGSASVDWIEWTNRLSIQVPAGEAVEVRVEPQRTRVKSAAQPGSVDYQSLLVVSDTNGFRRTLPVSMRIASRFGTSTARSAKGAKSSVPPDPKAGLWVGNVLIDQVNFSAHPSDPVSLRPAKSEFDFRILVHVDVGGRARFLQRAMVGQRSSTATGGETRLVIMTDEDLAQRLGVTGVGFRSDRPVVRRFSAPAFGFQTPISMEGLGQFGVGRLSCSVTNGFNDPLNPFKHLYHPNHDNLDPRLENPKLPEGIESFTVTREVQLTFSEKDLWLSTNRPNAYLPGFGDARFTGVYEETILGVHRRPIRLGGTFNLQRAVSVGVLNDGE